MISTTTAVLLAGLFLPVFDNALTPGCGPADAVEQHLRKKYGEERASSAITLDGRHLVERWESRETGTWTLLVRTTRGFLCVISAGTAWRETPISPHEKEL